MTGQGCIPLGSQALPIRICFFPHERDLLQAEIHPSSLWQQLWRTFLQSAFHLHAPSKLVVLGCVSKLHILEWSFIAPSTRCNCVMIILFNQLLDMSHLSGGWIILAKEKCSPTDVNKCVQNI